MNRSVLRAAIFLLVLIPARPLDAGARILSPGDFFPHYSFTADISQADAANLGITEVLKGSGGFQLADVWGDVLVLELFNRFCFGCQQGAPLMNRAYQMVAADPALSTKVRFLGVGVGNNMKTVNDFRREFDVLFPLAPDPRFGILDAVGNPGGTPYTMVLKKTPRGFLLVTAHFGVLDSAEELVDEIKKVAAGNTEELLAGARNEGLPPRATEELVPPIPETRIESMVLKSMERAGYGSVGLYSVKLPDGERVYIGESNRGKVFSRVISRLPVCDVCHPVHFILTFNPRGQVVDFDAIQVTKYWNREWTEEEVDQMRRRLLGLSALEEREFDPEVDAVSTATMSSSLIFDSLGKTGPVLAILKEKGIL